MIPRSVLPLVAGLLLAVCSGCSSFEARWKSAGADATATRWEGRWTSEKHISPGGKPAGGRLRAILEPAANGRQTAQFRANWMAFVSEYTMTLEPKTAAPRRPGVREFRGTHELSKMFGGTYRYDAQMAGDRLTARYTSSYDTGTFALQRLAASKDSPSGDAGH